MHKVVCQAAIPILLLALSGCGSESESESDVNSQLVTVKAIDGYLKNAKVYVDRNADNIADDNEFIGDTDREGKINLNVDDHTSYNLIVQAIAGVTSDSDIGGKIAHTYEMVASATSLVITPFSTLAKASGITLGELASDLNISEALLSGDYVAAKIVDNNAKQVHLLARSVVQTLGITLSSTLNDAELLNKTYELNSKLDTIDESKMDSQILILDDSGVAQLEDMLPTLDTFMDNKGYHSFSLNDFWLNGCAQSNGANCDYNNEKSYWEFDYLNKTVQLNGEVLTLNVDDDDSSFYVTNEEGLTSEMKDTFIYIADGFGIASSVDGDLHIYLNRDPLDGELTGLNAIPLDGISLNGKTLYHLYDQNRRENVKPWESDPKMTENTIIVTEPSTGKITIDGVDYTVIAANRDMYLIKAITDNHPSLLFKNQELATFIEKKWVITKAL